MIAFLRLAVFGLVGLTVLYVLLSIYSRSLRREGLEKEWDANPPADATPEARDAWIEKGMAAYQKSLRRKLIWLVYVIPVVVIGVLLYLVNYA